jgi:hypothetical protein
MPDDRFLHRRAGHSERVTMLTDLEFRVWIQMIVSADDFGVVRASAVTLQADNDHLSNRPARAVERCIAAVLKAELFHEFTHQRRQYAYQRDWQSFQKVAYPRTTNNPKPPAEALTACDEPTQRLFDIHPGGAGRKRKERSSDGSENGPETVADGSSLMRAGPPAKRLMANGERLEAHGYGGGVGEPMPDAWVNEFLVAYPPAGACAIHLVHAELQVVVGADRGKFDGLLMRLKSHIASARWGQDGGRYIPRADKYLRNGTHLQEMPPATAPKAVAPTYNEWICPHVEPCENRTYCQHRALMPEKYPVRVAS